MNVVHDVFSVQCLANMTLMQGSVTIEIDAPTERVWDLVSDVTRIGELSPETLDAQWTRGATGPAKGAYFKGKVKRNGKGPTYWTLCQVTDYQPGQTFEFGVELRRSIINTWRYDLNPLDGGDRTEITESFRLSPTFMNRVYWFLAGWARSKTNMEGMAATLARVKEIVEAETASEA